MNKFKLIGIIAFLAVVGLLLIGCGGKKGGSIEVTNNSGETVHVKLIEGKSKTHSDWGSGSGTQITHGNKATVSASSDDDYTLIWRTAYYWDSKEFSLSGEKEEDHEIKEAPKQPR
jgi:hypothetical protein